MKTTTLPLKYSMRGVSRHLALVFSLALVCFVLSPQAQAACQKGCFANNNTVLGKGALLDDSGVNNTAIGYFALRSNALGQYNTALGYNTLMDNTTGSWNTATGIDALILNTTGHDNTATGSFALYANVTGSYNTATGVNALSNNSGNDNIAVGFNAGVHLNTGGNNIYIGNVGVSNESKTIRIGTRQTHRATSIAGISGATVPTGVAVIIDGDGHLGKTTSSARFKEAIKPMDKASEAILALKPVTFHYKQELDPEGIPQFGLVAEEVEKVNPDLVARDEQGKPYTVRYEAVNAMLLNEFLKEHHKVEEQRATIVQLKAADAKQEEKISALTELVKAQAAQIQKVSDHLEASKAAPRMVVNNH